MKKSYVKPVMEMEGFAANEYVAACYVLTCEGFPWGNNQHVHTGNRTVYSDKTKPVLTDVKVTGNGGGNYTVKGYNGHWSVVESQTNASN